MRKAEIEAAAQALIRWFESQGISVKDGVLVMLYTIVMAVGAGEGDPERVLRGGIATVRKMMLKR